MRLRSYIAGLTLLVIHGWAAAALQAALPRVSGESAAQSAVQSIAAEDVRPHVEYLASPELQGRSGEGARLAAEYIRDHFRHIGLKPLFPGDSFFQDLPGVADDNGEADVAGRNVGGWIRGSDPVLRDELIIISAHYDHLGTKNGAIFRGADDNASGVSMLLETARVLAALPTPPKRSIAFVGFDLEERMLWGSRWFAAHSPWPLEKVRLFITADMIGRSLGNLPLPAVFAMGSEHAPLLKQSLDRADTSGGLEVCRLGIDLVGTRSDYGPFRDRKIPFLFFSTGEHPDYHSPRDVPERVDYRKVAQVSNLILSVGVDVADSESPPRWTDNVGTDLDEAKALHRITTLLLEAEKQRPLSDFQRVLVTHAHGKTRQILERGEMSSGERQWLVRLSQLMLLSVF